MLTFSDVELDNLANSVEIAENENEDILVVIKYGNLYNTVPENKNRN